MDIEAALKWMKKRGGNVFLLDMNKLTVQSALWSAVFSGHPSLSAVETLSHGAGTPLWHALHFMHTLNKYSTSSFKKNLFY